MDNFDAEIFEWVRQTLIAKGGLGSGAQIGHIFLGNQYTSAGGGEKRQAAAGGGGNPPRFSGNQYPKPNRGGEQGMLETTASRNAGKQSHEAWVKGGMKGNSPFTTRILGQTQVPVGAHLSSPLSINAVKGDELARRGDHYGAASAYREAQEHTNGKTTFIGAGRGGRNVVLPASKEWKMAQEAADFHDRQDELNKSASEITKGGPIEPENRRPGSWREIEAISRQRLAARRRASAEKKDGESKATGEHTVGDYPGHPFRGNQYTKSVDDVVEKGDVAGHDFHGNQYTADHHNAKSGVLAHASRGENPDHAAIAEGHRELASWHKAQAEAIYKTKIQPLERIMNTEHGDAFHRAYNAYGEASHAVDAHRLAQKNHEEAAQLHEQASRGETPFGTRSSLNDDPRNDAMFSQYTETSPSSASDRASDSTYFANQNTVDIAKSVVVEKGDTPGHEFHGNQWTSGESGKIFDNYRPCDINQTISQIGKMNILGISGGRVNPLRNTAGEPVGIHLPVGKGYGVNVLLHPNDTYTVQRVTTRSGVVKIKGQEDGIYAEDLGDTAYRAGMYVNVPFGDHKGTLG